MKMQKKALLPALGLTLMAFTGALAAGEDEKTIAAKSGETVDVMPVYGASKCKSTLVAPPEVEVLQGPPEVKLSIREEEVTPPRCRDKVKGGFVVATIGDIKQPTEGKLTFRVKYKTKEGTVQRGHVYNLTLFPK